MARSFLAASTQYGKGSAPLSGTPFTVAGWFYPTQSTLVQALWSIGDLAASNYFTVTTKGGGAVLAETGIGVSSGERTITNCTQNARGITSQSVHLPHPPGGLPERRK